MRGCKEARLEPHAARVLSFLEDPLLETSVSGLTRSLFLQECAFSGLLRLSRDAEKLPDCHKGTKTRRGSKEVC